MLTILERTKRAAHLARVRPATLARLCQVAPGCAPHAATEGAAGEGRLPRSPAAGWASLSRQLNDHIRTLLCGDNELHFIP